MVKHSEEIVFLGTPAGDWPHREERLAKLRLEGGFRQVIELTLGRELSRRFHVLTDEDAGSWIPFLEEAVVRGAKLGCWKTCRDGVSVYVYVRENGLCWDVGTRKDFEAKGWGELCNRADRDASG
jgi:hypothetical protein